MWNNNKKDEDAGKRRIEEIQKEINYHTQSRNDEGLRFLSLRLEVQTKLEDYRIKFREAHHAKVKVWGPIFLPWAASFISLIISILVVLGILHAPGKH